MKKICIITGIFPPRIGGPATLLSRLALALIEKGYSIKVITYGDDNKKIPDYPFPVRRISLKKPIPFRIFLFIIYIFKEGRKSDMFFVSDYGVPAMIANLFLRKKMVIRIVEDFAYEYSLRHGLTTDLLDEFQEKKYSLTVELLRKIRNMYIRGADVVVVPSEYFKKIVSDWGIDSQKIRVIYNAIDTKNLELSLSKEEARKRLNLEGKILLSVARLTPWKGIDTVIKTLPYLPENIKFLVIGDGSYLPHLQNLVKEKGLGERVEFLGSCSHSSTFLYMKAADVFILDSGYEGLAHVLLEAMLAEVPIIASDKGGNPELICDQENGFLVPYGDTEALRKAINAILENQDLAKKFINNSREKVKDFNWDRLVREVLSVINY
ncbi:D-inositol-3-phosphate glycosyltransferase [subsurface metagenome]